MSTFFVDGSAHPNPGPGGFGVIQIENDKPIFAYTKQCERTTNNREELKAILWVMLTQGKHVTDWYGGVPAVYSDSAYSINTLTQWMFNWAKNGWLKSDNKPPENLDLIQAYYNHYQDGYRIDLIKVKGHSTSKWNNLTDLLATGKITTEEVLNAEY